MTRYQLAALIVLAALPFMAGCPATVPNPDPPQSNCPADDPRVGETAEIQGHMHYIQGTVRIVSNCEIDLEHFYYDNVGLDVRVVAVINGDRQDLIPLTSNIRDNGPYNDATLTIPLPAGVTLDDVKQISIVCVTYGIDFADATFE